MEDVSTFCLDHKTFFIAWRTCFSFKCHRAMNQQWTILGSICNILFFHSYQTRLICKQDDDGNTDGKASWFLLSCADDRQMLFRTNLEQLNGDKKIWALFSFLIIVLIVGEWRQTVNYLSSKLFLQLSRLID